MLQDDQIYCAIILCLIQGRLRSNQCSNRYTVTDNLKVIRQTVLPFKLEINKKTNILHKRPAFFGISDDSLINLPKSSQMIAWAWNPRIIRLKNIADLSIHYPRADITYFDKLKFILNSPDQTTDKFNARLILQISEYNNKIDKRKKCRIFNSFKIYSVAGSFLPELPYG